MVAITIICQRRTCGRRSAAGRAAILGGGVEADGSLQRPSGHRAFCGCLAQGGAQIIKSKAMISKRVIKKIAREIAAHFHPRQVILFGSYAYGKPTEDSD